jgi:Putative Ig domain
VAAYGFASPPMPAGWRAWTFWQYTATGTVRGVDSPGGTDLDVFNTGLVGLIDPGNQASRAGTKVSLGITSLAAAGRRPLAYTATGLPRGLAIVATGRITGVVTAPAGTYRVTVSARNTAGAAGSVTFTWRVTGTVPSPSPSPSAANPFPSLSPMPLRTGRGGRGRRGDGRGGPHPGAQP